MSPTRETAAVLALLALAGCTYLVPSPCDDEACPGNVACDPDGFCPDGCANDDECIAGTVCQGGECEDACRDPDCDRGNTCDEATNSCRDDCSIDGDCQDGWYCCGPLDDCREDRTRTCVRE